MRTVVHFTDGQVMGGTERIVLQLLAGVDRRRWQPLLFYHPAPALAPMLDEARHMDVEVRPVPRMGTVADIAQLPRFIRAVRDAHPAVLHAHLSWPLSCKYGILAAFLSRVPAVVATAHLYMDILARPLLRWQPWIISMAVDRYLAVSEGIARQLRDEFRLPSGKVEVVRNGVSLAAFRQPGNTELRTALTRGTEQPVVLTVARLASQKGHRHLIDAIPLVPDAIFLFAGDGPERARLEAQASKLGVSDRIRFLGQRKDIPDLLAAADLFVLPSLYEGLPLSIMEAMASSTPVIATSIRGTDELVTDNQTGLLVPPAEPSALASAIRTLLASPDTARTLASNAQRRALERYSVEQMVQRVQGVYEEILAQ